MQEQWAGIWDHVEDLRRTLIQSLFIVGIGFFFFLLFYQPIFHFLANQPFQKEEKIVKQQVKLVRVKNTADAPLFFDLPSREHSNIDVEDAGKRIYLEPGQVFVYEEVIDSPLLIMGPMEGIFLVFKVCFWLSLAATSPMWGWIWLHFVLPGLKEKERVIVFPFILLSFFFIFTGVGAAYFFTLPIANRFFIEFNHTLAQNAWTLMHYLDYVLLLCLGHAVAAELALLLFVLVHFHVVSVDWLIEKRRIMILVAFILAALLTPPDVLTQLFLAFPLVGLYELAIQYARWRKRVFFRKKP